MPRRCKTATPHSAWALAGTAQLRVPATDEHTHHIGPSSRRGSLVHEQDHELLRLNKASGLLPQVK